MIYLKVPNMHGFCNTGEKSWSKVEVLANSFTLSTDLLIFYHSLDQIIYHEDGVLLYLIDCSCCLLSLHPFILSALKHTQLVLSYCL